MKIFGVFLIVGALGLSAHELLEEEAYIHVYPEASGPSHRMSRLELALVHFISDQTATVLGILVPWLMLGGGISLLCHRKFRVAEPNREPKDVRPPATPLR